MIEIEAFPLHWSAAWPRTAQPQRSRFDTIVAQARDGLLHELRLLGAKQIVLSTNYRFRQDGLPYAVQR
jgi:hypothetical protein